MKKTLILASIILVVVVASIVWFQSSNKSWAFESLKINQDDLPLSEEHAQAIANRHVEGRINTYLPNQDSAWNTVSGIKWSDYPDEEIDNVTDQGDYFVVEFRHRGDFCDQKVVYVEKETGHVIKVKNGYSDHEACK
ncbi:hypothetical protein [Aquisalibacillus elongatus]|uniref:Uncharacterized protein n=1 Tax=Aquisalibacillus elongatus TaxID=485577 RepID=A0A3N5B868_9BACI|nr:hypothetical protein [Aquisalibacillus elongatus]RPF53936.1 hypothetical protein EDC24_1121 [Aquisalibacillus elongatus]